MAPSSDLDRSRACTLWVHANDDGADVLFNPQHLPTAKEGDVIHLHRDNGLAKANGLLFHVPPGGREHKRTLQVSVSDGIAQAFDLSNREQIILSKVRISAAS